jgi:hypothetical protein
VHGARRQIPSDAVVAVRVGRLVAEPEQPKVVVHADLARDGIDPRIGRRGVALGIVGVVVDGGHSRQREVGAVGVHYPRSLDGIGIGQTNVRTLVTAKVHIVGAQGSPLCPIRAAVQFRWQRT